MAKFVFVPGAWHGGWSFDRVRPLLEERGHTVLTPTLSGVGERSHLSSLGSINLQTHILDIVNIIKWRDLRDVVLCGHSSGGLVITGTADLLPDRIASLAYIDAPVPVKHGDSLCSLLPMFMASFIDLSGSLGGTMVAPMSSKSFGIEEKDQVWVDSKLSPQPLACFTQKISLTGEYKKIGKRIFIYNSRYLGIDVSMKECCEAQRGLPGNHVYSLEGSHDLMIDHAREIADILIETL